MRIVSQWEVVHILDSVHNVQSLKMGGGVHILDSVHNA